MNTFAALLKRIAVAAICMTVAGPALAATPTMDQLLEKAIEAMGGKTAIDSIKTLHVASEMAAPAGTMTGEVFWARPNHVIVRRNMPQMGDIEMGTDGKIGWINHPMLGYQLVTTPQEVKQIRNQALHVRILKLNQTVDEQAEEVLGITDAEFGGTKAYELKIKEREGDKERTNSIYFDTNSGLILGMHVTGETANPSTVWFKDWQSVNNVQFFMTMVVDEGQGSETTITFSKISVNDTDLNVFAVPEQVKQKAAEEKADDAKLTLEHFSTQMKDKINGWINEMPNSVDELKAYRTVLEARVKQATGETKKAIEYVIQKINEKVKALSS